MAPKPHDEATPQSNLRPDQRLACQKIDELILALDESAKTAAKEAAAKEDRSARTYFIDAVAPDIQVARPSNVFLIDGRPNTGKTTTLLTLLDGWAKAFRSPSSRPTFRESTLQEAKVLPLQIIDF